MHHDAITMNWPWLLVLSHMEEMLQKKCQVEAGTSYVKDMFTGRMLKWK